MFNGWNTQKATAEENSEMNKMLATIKNYFLFQINDVGKQFIVGIMKYHNQDEQREIKISRKHGREYGIDESNKGWQKISKQCSHKYLGEWY